MIRLSWSARLLPLRHLGNGANVFFSGAAAAADHVQPTAIGEALELLRQGFPISSWSARLLPLRHLGNGANVFFSGAAAAADHVQPTAIGEALELLRQGFRRLAV